MAGVVVVAIKILFDQIKRYDIETIKENLVEYSGQERRSFDNKGFISFGRIFCIDFLLLNLAFFICYFFKRGNLELTGSYARLLFMFYLCWLVTSFMSKKFKPASYIAYGTCLLTFLRSFFYLTYSITFLVVVFGFASYSRLHVFSTCLMVLVLDCLVWCTYNKIFNSRATDRVSLKNILASIRLENNVSWSLVFMDLILVIAAFFMVNYLKRGHLALLPGYSELFVIMLGLWFVFSAITRKFSMGRFKNVYFFIWQWIKAGGLMLATMTVLIFGLRLFYFSRFQALGSILILMALEFVMISFYYIISQGEKPEQDTEADARAGNRLKQEDIPLNFDVDIIRQKLMEPARETLKTRFASNNPELFEFMVQHMVLNDMLRMETAFERSCEMFGLVSERVPTRLFFNYVKLNDIRRMNAYFLWMHGMLLPGGYFVGNAHTIETHYKWIYEKFPRYIAGLIYTVDFCFNRVMPKLPGLQKVYFAITGGKGRVVSRAELLGRLSFCGFKIVAEREIDQRLYVIARKVKTSSLDTSPTYGPLVQLKRAGWGGEMVNTYKFRTMHPYSEYLQEYVYDLAGLQKGG
ncbi:MAG: sugar transferase, partial [Proteobacteria bacterium]|nr:sugar transferase [Pseudomonadota bacterium]